MNYSRHVRCLERIGNLGNNFESFPNVVFTGCCLGSPRFIEIRSIDLLHDDVEGRFFEINIFNGHDVRVAADVFCENAEDGDFAFQ